MRYVRLRRSPHHLVTGTRTGAERFLCQVLVQFINEHCTLGVDHFRDESKFSKKNRVRKCYRNDLAVLEELSSYYNCGDDVSLIMSWEVKDVTIDNEDVQPQQPQKRHKTSLL